MVQIVPASPEQTLARINFGLVERTETRTKAIVSERTLVTEAALISTLI